MTLPFMFHLFVHHVLLSLLAALLFLLYTGTGGEEELQAKGKKRGKLEPCLIKSCCCPPASLSLSVPSFPACVRSFTHSGQKQRGVSLRLSCSSLLPALLHKVTVHLTERKRGTSESHRPSLTLTLDKREAAGSFALFPSMYLSLYPPGISCVLCQPFPLPLFKESRRE